MCYLIHAINLWVLVALVLHQSGAVVDTRLFFHSVKHLLDKAGLPPPPHSSLSSYDHKIFPPLLLPAFLSHRRTTTIWVKDGNSFCPNTERSIWEPPEIMYHYGVCKWPNAMLILCKERNPQRVPGPKLFIRNEAILSLLWGGLLVSLLMSPSERSAPCTGLPPTTEHH